MTVERFEDMYRFLVEQRINDFGNTCEHPHFDKLLEVINSPRFGYELFHPLSNDFDKYGIDFDTYCRKVWENVEHAVEDDGDICFVHAVFSGKTGGIMDKVRMTDVFFVMDGHIAEVREEQVFEIARKHQPMGLSLASYSGIRFDWELVDFLHGMIGEFKELEKVEKEACSFCLNMANKTSLSSGHNTYINMERACKEMEKAIYKKFDNYMVAQRGYFNSLKGAT